MGLEIERKFLLENDGWLERGVMSELGYYNSQLVQQPYSQWPAAQRG